MLKILTPAEVVLQCVEKNEFCRVFILRVNEELSKVERPTDGYYTFVVVTDEEIVSEDRALIQKAFNIFGWDISISSKWAEDEDGTQIVENKVLLTKKIPSGGK